MPTEVLVVLLTVAGTVLAALLTAWPNHRKSSLEATSLIINELQQQVQDLSLEIKAARADLTGMSQEIRSLTSYAFQLQRHIEAELGPPVPPVPQEVAKHFPSWASPRPRRSKNLEKEEKDKDEPP